MLQIARHKKCKALLLALGACASLLELGPIITLIREDSGILPILLAGLSYQIGNATPYPRNLGKFAPLFAITLLASIGVLTAPTSTVTWYASIALMGWALQFVRRWLTTQSDAGIPKTAQKRIARVVGFIFAAVFDSTVWLALVVIVMTSALMFVRKIPLSQKKSTVSFSRLSRLEWTMLVHQMHYFAYCYAVPLLTAETVLGGSTYIGLWFAAGWVSYLSAEALWSRFNPSIVFLCGHTFLAFVLILMWGLQPWPFASLLLWILSGFGGGSVFCITLMHRSEGLDHSRLEHSEDLGHLLGVVLAIAMILLGNEVSVLPLTGALLALMAAFLMATYLTSSMNLNQRSSK